ncbi:hypothetical protein DPMN_033962 [Dreissena polymorpha]|uniref:Uncharacterized protein n=1 Tax=Dreissena polymorpha TaxID=45954 RepID=A0A9D4M4L1_DREPO|nr:hypothetical protein DPMN_033962 [Dreissena polymorpha]
MFPPLLFMNAFAASVLVVTTLVSGCLVLLLSLSLAAGKLNDGAMSWSDTTSGFRGYTPLFLKAA